MNPAGDEDEPPFDRDEAVGDDDALPGLPPLGARLDDAEPTGVEGGDQVGEREAAEAIALPEAVGLDDTTPEAFDPLFGEVLGEAELGGETGHLEGTELGGDSVGGLDEGLSDGGGEYGWTEGNDAADELALDEAGDERGLPDERSGLVDAGEEGLVEDDRGGAPLGAEDAFGGPSLSLDDDVDEGAEGLLDDGPLEAELGLGAALSWEEELELEGRALPPMLEAGAAEAVRLDAPGDALVAVAEAGGRVWAGGQGLYRLRGGELVRLPGVGLPEDEVTSLAPHPAAPDVIVVGTRLGGALRSDDAGTTFHPVNGWWHRPGEPPVAFEVMAERTLEPGGGEGGRLWGRTAAGALWRSEDFGDQWVGPVLPAPVRAMAPLGEGPGVVALTVAAGGAPGLLRSDDGGRSWTAWDAGAGGPGGLGVGLGGGLAAAAGGASVDEGDGLRVAGAGAHAFAVAAWSPRAVWHWTDGRRAADLEGLTRARALAAIDAGEEGTWLFAASFFEAGERAAVVGARVAGGPPAAVRVVDVAGAGSLGPPLEDPERVGRFHALVARQGDDGRVRLFAAGAGGLWLVRFASGALRAVRGG